MVEIPISLSRWVFHRGTGAPVGSTAELAYLEAVGSAKANSFVGGAQLMKPFGEVLISADPALQQSNGA